MNTQTNKPPPWAKYDDQGLFFSLVLAGALLLLFLPTTMFFVSTSKLWLKRLYRPNHTTGPPPLQPRSSGQSAESPTAEQTMRSADGTTVIRRKRLGISLPYRSSFFFLPTLRDWISVEENVPHLESALSPRYVSEPVSAEFFGTRVFAPLTGAAAASSSALASGMGGNSRLSPTYSESSQQRSYGALSPTTHAQQMRTREGGNGTRAGIHELPSFASPSAPEPPTVPSSTDLPKTPLDPQVALYIFTLKFFATVMFVGELCTIWICVIASRDNYIERYIVRRDIYKCHRFNSNQTGCASLKPFCSYDDSQHPPQCYAVPLRGLYDMSVQNIRPKSDLWWGVAILNVCFCIVFIVGMLYFLRTVNHYIDAVLQNQMQHALGHRVACVRGVESQYLGSVPNFYHNFIEDRVYFPPNRRRGASHEDGFLDDDECYEDLDCSGLGCLFSVMRCSYHKTYRRDAVFTQPNKVEQVLFTRDPPPGMYPCIGRAERSMARLQDIIADDKAMQRRNALRSRRRSSGEDSNTASVVVIENGSSASGMAAPAGASPVSPSASGFSDSASQAPRDPTDVLLMRAPFPSCCNKIPAVPYCESRFRHRAGQLNDMIEKVPRQRTDGAVFVVFTDSRCAYEFVSLFNIRFGGWLSSASAVIAGPAGRIVENNLRVDKVILAVRFVVLFVVFVVLLFTWSIPVSFLSSLENIARIPGVGPGLYNYYVKLPSWLRQIFTAYLPVIMLSVFNVVLPFIIRFIVLAMGAFNKAECDAGHLYLQYIFMVLTAVIFQAALQGGLDQLGDLIANPDGEAVINFFVACVTPRGGYWYAKVIMAFAISPWLDVLDPMAFLKAFLMRGRAHIQRNYDALFIPCEFELSRHYSFDLMILSIGLLFHMTVPLLGLFVVVYFVLRAVAQRTKLYDRYRPTLTPAHDYTDFGISAQVIRSVAWLFCLSEIGGVMLMRLRGHTGGTVLCSITFALSAFLLMFVNVQSRRWTASLGNARRYFYKTGAAYESGPAPPAGEADATVASKSGAETPPPRTAALQNYVEADVMAAYEDQRFSLFQVPGNPFIGYLLPRLPNPSSLYQPKHQRLARIDINAEVMKMKMSRFTVERYWDRGMTWFEGDADYGDLANPAGGTLAAADAKGRQSSGEAEAMRSRSPSGAEAVELEDSRGQLDGSDELHQSWTTRRPS